MANIALVEELQPCTRQSLVDGNDTLWDIIMGQVKSNRRLRSALGLSLCLNVVLASLMYL